MFKSAAIMLCACDWLALMLMIDIEAMRYIYKWHVWTGLNFCCGKKQRNSTDSVFYWFRFNSDAIHSNSNWIESQLELFHNWVEDVQSLNGTL